MKFFKKRNIVTIFLVVLTMIMVTSVAYAITITIDGVQDAVWTTGSGTQMPGAATDPNEDGTNSTPVIDDDADIATVRWTNDAAFYYLLIETHGSPTRHDTGLATRIDICLDTDNDTTTPGGSDSYVNCDEGNMDGIERLIRITPLAGGNLQWQVTSADFGTFYAFGNTQSEDIATATNITELRIPLDDLGIDTTATCNGTMQMNVYFDGGTTQSDDNIPDSGTIASNCGSPTAVTLYDIQAGTASSLLPFGVIGFVILGVVTFGIYRVRRIKNQ